MLAVDAGPLVALLDRTDRHHRACVEVFKQQKKPMVTTWPALTEAFYLLGEIQPQLRLWEFLRRGAIEIGELGRVELRMESLMRQYADLPMDLADASLVAVCEEQSIASVFTIDRGDFSIYRPSHVKRFELLP